MTEITSSRISSAGHSDPEPDDQPSGKPRQKSTATDQSASGKTPEIEETDEDKHTLDERA